MQVFRKFSFRSLEDSLQSLQFLVVSRSLGVFLLPSMRKQEEQACTRTETKLGGFWTLLDPSQRLSHLDTGHWKEGCRLVSGSSHLTPSDSYNLHLPPRPGTRFRGSPAPRAPPKQHRERTHHSIWNEAPSAVCAGSGFEARECYTTGWTGAGVVGCLIDPARCE